MNKFLKGILVGVLGLLLLVSLIELSSNFISKIILSKKTVNNKPSNGVLNSADSLKQSKGSNKLKKNVEITATDAYIFLNKYFNLLKSKRFDEAYRLLYPEFVKQYYPLLEDFKKDVLKRYPTIKDKDVSIVYLVKYDDDKYIGEVKLMDNEFAEHSSPTIIEKFTIYGTESNDYNVAFFGFIESKKVDYNTSVGNVKLNIINITRYFKNTEITLEVYNGEQQAISLLDYNLKQRKEQISLTSEYNQVEGEEYLSSDSYLLNNNVLLIEPQNQKQYVLNFNVYSNCQLKKLTFYNIKVGNEIKKAEIKIE